MRSGSSERRLSASLAHSSPCCPRDHLRFLALGNRWKRLQRRGTRQFDYIEMFYNPKRKHVRNGMLSPVEFERQQEM
ncbi:IS3 family transposase [Stappia indica]|uniref:IS3 family transposase n=1 Tax=Stappia indica TaxID=538381 RepID=UPI00384AD085